MKYFKIPHRYFYCDLERSISMYMSYFDISSEFISSFEGYNWGIYIKNSWNKMLEVPFSVKENIEPPKHTLVPLYIGIDCGDDDELMFRLMI